MSTESIKVFRPYHPTAFPLTDAGVLRLRVQRFTVGDAAAFRRTYDAVKERASLRQVAVRLPGEEMAKQPVSRPRTAAEQALAVALERLDEQGPSTGDPVGDALAAVVQAARDVIGTEPTEDIFVVSDDEIRLRRLGEMSPEARAAWDALVAEEDEKEAAFIEDTVTRFITVEPDQMVEVDAAGAEQSLTQGADLLRVFGAHLGDMRGLVQLVRIENELPEDRKKIWRSLFGFGGSSAAPAKEVTGIAPEPTVDVAELKDSAAPEAVTDVPVT